MTKKEANISKEINRSLPNITLIPLTDRVDSGSLRQAIGNHKHIMCFDFHVTSSASEEILLPDSTLVGYKDPETNVSWIDHHAPDRRMWRTVSTTPLVCRYVENYGTVGSEVHPVLNHTDADSVLAVWTAMGLLDHRDPRFSQAALAADHTGEPNDIADLLNGIEDTRDVEFSWFCLIHHLSNTPLPARAKQGLDRRRRDREEALEAVARGEFQQMYPGVYVHERQGSGTHPMRTEFVAYALPHAQVIVTSAPRIGIDGYDYKIRIGPQWPAGHSLHELQLPQFSGRWNAGGTMRASVPANLRPEQYADEIHRRLGNIHTLTP